MQRIAVFCDWNHWVPQRLLPALLNLVAESSDQRIVAVCTPEPLSRSRMMRRHLRDKARGIARGLYFGDAALYYRPPAPLDLPSLSRHNDFETLVARDANAVDFLARLRAQADPDVALSIFWLSRFRRPFLSSFSQVVNYHNGEVPGYRGLKATPWSIYRGESSSGFTVHRVNAGLDLGNVLVTGSVPIRADSTVFDVEWRKTNAAIGGLESVLAAIRDHRPGTPQTEPGRYNDVREIASLTQIDRPVEVASADLLRRIRCFGFVRVRVGDATIWLSGLGARVVEPSASRGMYVTLADGTWRIKAADLLALRLRRLAATGRAAFSSRT